MHTISSLRKALGLTTTHQVRNRIDAVRDLLEPFLRRGPNNQILVADDGLALLRSLQELLDSGLRLTEASQVLQSKSLFHVTPAVSVSSTSRLNQSMPDETVLRALRALQEDVGQLRSRVAALERAALPPASSSRVPAEGAAARWWTRLQEDVDGA
ncbi:MAG: hypothetical protein AB1778_04920 [Candidatus Bipolaricaulota bacterium]